MGRMSKDWAGPGENGLDVKGLGRAGPGVNELGWVSVGQMSKDWAGSDVKGLGWAGHQWAGCQRTGPVRVSMVRAVCQWAVYQWAAPGVNGLDVNGPGPVSMSWMSKGRARCQWMGPAQVDVKGLG